MKNSYFPDFVKLKQWDISRTCFLHLSCPWLRAGWERKVKMHEKVASNHFVPPRSHPKDSSVLPVSLSAAPCLAPAQRLGCSQVLFIHHLKGTLWCRIVQRSRLPVQKHLLHFPHHHRCNLKTNTAWHRFSQISPKYSTLPLSTRDTKKGYSLWPLTETSCQPFPWTAWQCTFGLHLHPSLLSTAGQLNR